MVHEGDKNEKVLFSVLYIFCFYINVPKIQNKNHKGIRLLFNLYLEIEADVQIIVSIIQTYLSI